MTPITDMELPEAVIDAMFEAQDQIMRRYNEEDATSPMPFNAKQKRKEELMSATFRAALQAMCDCGMARLGTDCCACWNEGSQAWVHQDKDGENFPVAIIRIDNADERKRGEGKEGEKDGK